jgi:5'-AMP-activated protein kinase catalytic alpha subunit
MKALNFQWKVVTAYHARCRCWNQVSGSIMKMSLQLFDVANGDYLLDLQALYVA